MPLRACPRGPRGRAKPACHTSSPALCASPGGVEVAAVRRRLCSAKRQNPGVLTGFQLWFPNACTPSFQCSRLLLRERKHSDPGYGELGQKQLVSPSG